MPDPARPAYRPEIDGLRAIAVLAVVLYHFGVPGLGGGFTGVDVFFVISGYLIGGLLWAELHSTGRISLRNFYARRIRRLAPAYFAMAAASLFVAALVLLPFEFRAFGKTLIASTLWLSNVHFYRESGYFDGLADDKILLHTWSLSVEEQFYVVLPMLFVLLARWRGILPGTLAGALVLSLLACLVLSPWSQPAAFYLFPFRAWELLAGVLLAVQGQRRGADWAGMPALSWAGLLLVLASVVMVRPDGFPGLQALAPVVGTVLLLVNGGDDNAVNRLLSRPLPVGLGLMSYSLYLWHWPVLTLSRYWREGHDSAAEAALWCLLAFALAYASWRWVETPLRHGRAGTGRLFGGLAVASVALLAVGGAIWKRDGMPARFAPEVRTHIEASADFLQDWSRCTVPDDGPLAGIETCPIGPDGPPRVLVWGDSHVRAFKEGLDLAAQEAGTPALIIWHAGCPPLFGIEKSETAATPAQDAACTAANDRIRAALPQMPGLRDLLLIGRWSYYAEGRGVGLDAHNRIALRPVAGGSLPDAPQAELLGLAWGLGTKVLAQDFDRIFVLRQVPEIPAYDSRLAARRLARSGADLQPGDVARSFDVALAEARARTARAEAPLRDLAAADRITLIDPWPDLCGRDTCSAMRNGKSLYFDNNHITNDAARQLRHLFAPVFGRGMQTALSGGAAAARSP